MTRETIRRLLGAFLFSCLVASADPVVVRLWPGEAPGSEGIDEEEIWIERGKGFVDRSVANVHEPTLTLYPPLREKATGTAIIVCPGGGFQHLAIDKEGHDVAKWLSSIGVAGLVLKYRLPRTKGHNYTRETALDDARQALRVARRRAEEWAIDPRRIGMMSFSAGGVLTTIAGTQFDAPDTRPDFLVPVYGAEENSKVTAETPPAFIVHVGDDPTVDSQRSIRFYLELKKAKVPAELHIYAKGGHGFGIRNRGLPISSWPLRLRDWLRDQGFLGRK